MRISDWSSDVCSSDLPFNLSVSLLVECDTQEEVDTLWSRLTEGGTEAPCGWLKDRYGLAWQITPKRLLELVTGADREVAAAAMRAMFEMTKIVIDALETSVPPNGWGEPRESCQSPHPFR